MKTMNLKKTIFGTLGLVALLLLNGCGTDRNSTGFLSGLGGGGGIPGGGAVGPYTCNVTPPPGLFIIHVLANQWSPNGNGQYDFGASSGSNQSLHPLINPAVPLPINGNTPVTIQPRGNFNPFSQSLEFVGTHSGVTGIPVTSGTKVTFSGEVEWRNHVPTLFSGGSGRGAATMLVSTGLSVMSLGTGVINTTATMTNGGCLFFGGDQTQAQADDAIRFDINTFLVNYLQ